MNDSFRLQNGVLAPTKCRFWEIQKMTSLAPKILQPWDHKMTYFVPQNEMLHLWCKMTSINPQNDSFTIQVASLDRQNDLINRPTKDISCFRK